MPSKISISVQFALSSAEQLKRGQSGGKRASGMRGLDAFRRVCCWLSIHRMPSGCYLPFKAANKQTTLSFS